MKSASGLSSSRGLQGSSGDAVADHLDLDIAPEISSHLLQVAGWNLPHSDNANYSTLAYPLYKLAYLFYLPFRQVGGAAYF